MAVPLTQLGAIDPDELTEEALSGASSTGSWSKLCDLSGVIPSLPGRSSRELRGQPGFGEIPIPLQCRNRDAQHFRRVCLA